MWKKLGREQDIGSMRPRIVSRRKIPTAEVAVGPPRRPAASEFAVLVSTSGI